MLPQDWFYITRTIPHLWDSSAPVLCEMEPLSIATACYTLLTAVTNLSRSLTTFTNSVRGARKDVDSFLRELGSLALCLETLRDEEFSFPNSLKTQLVRVLNNCDGVVEEMLGVLDKYRHAGLLRQIQWSASDSQEVARIRQRLEAYKSVLEITLELANLTVLNGVRGDTGNILAEVAALRTQVAELSVTNPNQNPILQRFLDETVTYAESLADPFTGEDRALTSHHIDAAQNGASQSASSMSSTSSISPEPAALQTRTTLQSGTQPFRFSRYTLRDERIEPRRQDPVPQDLCEQQRPAKVEVTWTTSGRSMDFDQVIVLSREIV